MNSFRYILRYYIDPLFEPELRTEELLRFCEEAKVDEVMLFQTPEELNAGHPTNEEWELHIDLAKKVKSRLSEIEVDLSLNPWTTIYHTSRGRRLRDGQDFRLMVGETGVASTVAVCPLCETWQRWICDSFARLAKEVQPTAIWIEDDWRLHNHGPELGAGGCYCPEHLRRFGETIGEPDISLDRLLKAILSPGSVHPWREKWFSLSQASILEPLQLLCRTITDANASTRPALMTSVPDVLSSEGYDWGKVRTIVGERDSFLVRPHMPPYTQLRSMRATPAVLRQAIACLTADDQLAPIKLYPELENAPRSGIYSKSGSSSVAQMLDAAIVGSAGITINHFDMMGTGISLDPHFANYLAQAKPRLDALRQLNLQDTSAAGPRVLFSQKVSTYFQTTQEPSSAFASLRDLTQPSVIWSEICSILGFSHRLVTQVGPSSSPLLVSGQTLRAYSDEEIRMILSSGAVVLDAYSVEVLIERGFQAEIGIGSAQFRQLNETAYAYEQIVHQDENVFRYGLATPRMSAQRCALKLLEMHPTAGTRVRTTIHHANRELLWPGCVEYQNRAGGRVISLCYPLDGSWQFFMGFFNVYRREFLKELFTERSSGHWAVADDGVRCHRLGFHGGTFIALFNPTDDGLSHSSFQCSPDLENHFWQYLTDNGEWHDVRPVIETIPNAILISFQLSLPPLGARFLIARPKDR